MFIKAITPNQRLNIQQRDHETAPDRSCTIRKSTSPPDLTDGIKSTRTLLLLSVSRPPRWFGKSAMLFFPRSIIPNNHRRYHQP